MTCLFAEWQPRYAERGIPTFSVREKRLVAPPSRGTKSDYQFIEGSLDDLDSLPVLRGIKIEAPQLLPAPMPDEVVTKGRRNKMLWEHCMRSARQCDDFGALLDIGQTRNQAFVPPLPDDEVFKLATPTRAN